MYRWMETRTSSSEVPRLVRETKRDKDRVLGTNRGSSLAGRSVYRKVKHVFRTKFLVFDNFYT